MKKVLAILLAACLALSLAACGGSGSSAPVSTAPDTSGSAPASAPAAADGSIAVTAPGYVPVYVWTFKNAAGADDYRVLPTGVYMNSRPDGMSDEQYSRMCETWNETTSLMGGDVVLKTLTE